MLNTPRPFTVRPSIVNGQPNCTPPIHDWKVHLAPKGFFIFLSIHTNRILCSAYHFLKSIIIFNDGMRHGVDQQQQLQGMGKMEMYIYMSLWQSIISFFSELQEQSCSFDEGNGIYLLLYMPY